MSSKTRKRDRLKKSIYLLPNLCTTASLFCGFFSIVKSLAGDFQAAAWAILLAGIFDLLDGRVARIAHAQSEFGIEYDSLVDLAAFGLAPGIMIYTWGLFALKKMGWLAAFFYFTCGALRLARYNLQHNTVETKHFQGLPIPVAAYVLATYVIFQQNYFLFEEVKIYFVLALTIALSLCMVSGIGYPSFKEFDLNKKKSLFILVSFAAALIVVAINPEATMFILVSAYVLYGPAMGLLKIRKKASNFTRKIKRREAKISAVADESNFTGHLM